MNSNEFSVLLGYFRNRVGLSQARLAEQIGCSRKSIIEWEKQAGNNPQDRGMILKMKPMLRLRNTELNQLLEAAGYLAFDPSKDTGIIDQDHPINFVSFMAEQLVEAEVYDLSENHKAFDFNGYQQNMSNTSVSVPLWGVFLSTDIMSRMIREYVERQ